MSPSPPRLCFLPHLPAVLWSVFTTACPAAQPRPCLHFTVLTWQEAAPVECVPASAFMTGGRGGPLLQAALLLPSAPCPSSRLMQVCLHVTCTDTGRRQKRTSINPTTQLPGRPCPRPRVQLPFQRRGPRAPREGRLLLHHPRDLLSAARSGRSVSPLSPGFSPPAGIWVTPQGLS